MRSLNTQQGQLKFKYWISKCFIYSVISSHFLSFSRQFRSSGGFFQVLRIYFFSRTDSVKIQWPLNCLKSYRFTRCVVIWSMTNENFNNHFEETMKWSFKSLFQNFSNSNLTLKWPFWVIYCVISSGNCIWKVNYWKAKVEGEFREISKFSLLSLNYHFWWKITKMITRLN